MKEYETLLIQVGHVENKQKLEVLIFELMMFKCFNYEGFCFLPKGTQIIVELENIIELSLRGRGFRQEKAVIIPEEYHLLKMIQEDKSKYLEIQKFSLENLVLNLRDPTETFVFLYLDMLHTNRINNEE